MVATGRSDYPNQINNVLAFPGVFRGALDARASDINDTMKLAAARALASLVGEDLSADYIIPAAFDPRVKDAVAAAVEQAAQDSGVAVLFLERNSTAKRKFVRSGSLVKHPRGRVSYVVWRMLKAECLCKRSSL